MLKLIKFSSNVFFGDNVLYSIPHEIESRSFPKEIIFISGENTFKLFGSNILIKIQNNDFRVTEKIIGIDKDKEKIDSYISKFSKDKKYTIVAVGSGSVLDAGKYIASKINSPLISIPTSLSTDAMATSFSVLWKKGSNIAIKTVAPSIIIGDYELLKNEDKRFIRAGIGDMLSKLSALYDWRLGFWLAKEKYNDFAYNLASYITKLIIRRLTHILNKDYIGIETLFLAEVTDGYLMEISNTTRVAAGSEHLFSFAMETLGTNLLHGELCGLGTIMMHFLQTGSHKAKDIFEKAQFPITTKQLGVNKEIVVKALTISHKMRNWYTILGKEGLTEGQAERLAKYSGVLE
jgi:glycerol-1-phosphate dehydrogenase [NAD(P)+]